MLNRRETLGHGRRAREAIGLSANRDRFRVVHSPFASPLSKAFNN